jgi:outer membrane immunogenic protein
MRAPGVTFLHGIIHHSLLAVDPVCDQSRPDRQPSCPAGAGRSVSVIRHPSLVTTHRCARRPFSAFSGLTHSCPRVKASRMKKFAYTFAVLSASGALAFAGSDTGSYSSGKEMTQVAPAPAEEFSWTGFYVGGHGGYGWDAGSTHFQAKPSTTSFFSLDTTTLSPRNDGPFGGGQIGYNYQLNRLVFGFETDFSGADFTGSHDRSPIRQIDGTTTTGILTAHEDINFFGTARGRIGFTPIPRLLLYGTGGLAYGHSTYSANTNYLNGARFPGGDDRWNVGWTAGGGAEYALTHHWSVKAEYLFFDLGNEGFNGRSGTSGQNSVDYNAQTMEHTAQIGLNYKF